ncbi:MAG: type VI secretion system baseplate subunit TssE [Deltaproteobacteria bacterium]
MREERLLERVSNRERDSSRRGAEDPQRISDSVLEHLRRILGTRQGCVPIADDYGVPEFTEYLHLGADAYREIERVLRTTIQKYEPRLKGVRVSFLPEEEGRLALRLQFQVVAKLTIDPRLQVRYETSIDGNGQVRLKD